MRIDTIRKQLLIGELYFFRTIFTLIDFIGEGFYYILLYKSSQQFSTLFIDLIIFFISLWAGLIIGNSLIPRIGYIKVFKLSFLINLFVMALLVVNISNLAILYPIFAILRAFPKGIFWSVNNNFLIRELGSVNMHLVISDVVSISYILQILLPVLVGAILSIDGNYSILFILSGSVSFICLLIPWKYNKKPRTQITSGEISKILRHKKFKKLSVLLLITSGIDASVGLSFAIVPFLFLNDEFKVGILVSITNFIAAFFAFMQRRKKLENIKKTAYLGIAITTLSNLGLVIFWGLPALIMRGLFSTVGGSLHSPLMSKLDLDIREEILGEDVNKSSSEMDVIIETVLTIGRVGALIIFLLIFIALGSENIFRMIILIYSIWVFLFLRGLIKLRNSKSNPQNFEDQFQS